MSKSIIEKLGITPGPWRFTEEPEHSCCYTHSIESKEGNSIADVDGHENAKLITTAPELLDSLIEEWKFIESYLASSASRNDGYWYNEFLNRQNTIKKVIEKACYPKKWEEIRGYYE